jgi:AraC family transcriptional regulator, regulatory protein of adaptative response / methylated-DNA-[protein]-cysteine methyltransferase
VSVTQNGLINVRHSDLITLKSDLNTKNNSPVEMLYNVISTPFGMMIIGGDLNGLLLCDFVNDPVEYTSWYKKMHPELAMYQGDCSLLQKVKSFLIDPLAFNDCIPVVVSATEFQLAVWKSVLDIPWGDTSTYASIAAAAGYPAAVRAVGTAIGKNPVLFVIPCHRVILSSGKCGNYLRGSVKKEYLLNYELEH